MTLSVDELFRYAKMTANGIHDRVKNDEDTLKVLAAAMAFMLMDDEDRIARVDMYARVMKSTFASLDAIDKMN
jgi:hypothetical protein